MTFQALWKAVPCLRGWAMKPPDPRRFRPFRAASASLTVSADCTKFRARWSLAVNATTATDLHGYIVHALAVDLSAIGTDEAMREARNDLAIVRTRFFRSGGSRSTYHMARLDWLEGSLKWRTEKRNPHRARDMVRRGRDLLTELEVPLDAACCAVDLELMWNPEHRGEARHDLKVWQRKAKSILPTTLNTGIDEILEALNAPSYFGWEKSFRAVARKIRETFEKLGSVLPTFVAEPRK